ncbi:hypothetical protein [Brachyspira hampsonii]|uniref:GTP-binding protein n=1 Tax=Brachyspira hampsonii TaxID=1287055 RepID=A0AAC9TWK3_9SPIR|nr:hypothetical protein [Brachyspira hampsonii]ASJ22672.1 GTP-binding protein [Brachyspira hampsonii]ELV05573.1 GTP-binding signal recognition particle SRP54 G- domain-containing protein [Brachyspira hampsonii 30599]MBW5380095.1 GTP-binding protein [Brachyspira hampsonii]MBW5410024.1 GTP-binding protein [Brachyspira hampsonii]OEJ16470.1 GTP-binding protein [Brachyspira hampsonii]
MAEIYSIKGKNKTDAIIDAEYVRNFFMLSNKDVKADAFLGFGMQTEHKLGIMLSNVNVMKEVLCDENKKYTLINNIVKCIKKSN